ncbi:MAG: hypothetical protein D6732_24855, partial [Methanobacteriota archaeon]
SIRTGTFYPKDSPTFDIAARYDFVVTPVDLFDQDQILRGINNWERYDQVVFGGFNELSRHILEELKLENKRIVIFCENEEEFLEAREYGSINVIWEAETAIQTIQNYVQRHDFIISNFSDVTNDLLFVSTVKKISPNSHVVQIVKYDEETEVFIIAGVEAVITPQRTISSYLVNHFLKDLGLPPSFVFANGHLFEIDGHQFNRKIRNLIKNRKGKILLILRDGKEIPKTSSIDRNDKIIIFLPE